MTMWKKSVSSALKAIGEADRVLLVVDATAPEALDPFALWPEFENPPGSGESHADPQQGRFDRGSDRSGCQ